MMDTLETIIEEMKRLTDLAKEHKLALEENTAALNELTKIADGVLYGEQELPKTAKAVEPVKSPTVPAPNPPKVAESPARNGKYEAFDYAKLPQEQKDLMQCANLYANDPQPKYELVKVQHQDGNRFVKVHVKQPDMLFDNIKSEPCRINNVVDDKNFNPMKGSLLLSDVKMKNGKRIFQGAANNFTRFDNCELVDQRQNMSSLATIGWNQVAKFRGRDILSVHNCYTNGGATKTATYKDDNMDGVDLDALSPLVVYNSRFTNHADACIDGKGPVYAVNCHFSGTERLARMHNTANALNGIDLKHSFVNCVFETDGQFPFWVFKGQEAGQFVFHNCWVKTKIGITKFVTPDVLQADKGIASQNRIRNVADINIMYSLMEQNFKNNQQYLGVSKAGYDIVRDLYMDNPIRHVIFKAGGSKDRLISRGDFSIELTQEQFKQPISATIYYADGSEIDVE